MVTLWIGPYFLAAAGGHALLTRTPLPGNSVAKFLLAGAASGLGLVGHLFAVYGVGMAAFSAIAAYAFACELYLFLFTMTASSVSVKLLLTLRRTDLSAAEIDAHY